jgi:hypothetical protein
MIDLSLRGNEVTVAISQEEGLFRAFQSVAMTAWKQLLRVR